MFFLKASFIRLYGLLALMVCGWSLWRLLGHSEWLWLAPLLVWGPLWLLNACRYLWCNVAYRDEREAPVMALALIGMALALLTGERDLLLWTTLLGLFCLLFYVLLASALTRGVRESLGDPQQLPNLGFQDAQGKSASLPTDGEPRLLVFFHSSANPYSRMNARELQSLVERELLPPAALVCVFPDRLPGWSQALCSRGVNCWVDREGHSCGQLGLWLRGGASGLFAGNALRPAVAIVGPQNKVEHWQVAANYRMPPCLTDLSHKLRALR